MHTTSNVNIDQQSREILVIQVSGAFEDDKRKLSLGMSWYYNDCSIFPDCAACSFPIRFFGHLFELSPFFFSKIKAVFPFNYTNTNNLLLSECEGHTGEYLPEVVQYGPRTARSVQK